MGTAGFVFGVGSGVGPGREFWVVDFPQVGQNFGKETFWITLSKFNGTKSCNPRLSFGSISSDCLRL